MTAIYCSCGVCLGHVVVINGIELLDTGASLARAYHGVCKSCGRDFHWVMTDAMLSRLIMHIRDLHGTINP